MKKLSIITSIAIIANFGLVGCGGGGSSASEAATDTSSIRINGTAIDPELKNALICLDMNGDENCTSGEPTTRTDNNGNFELDLSKEQLEGDYPLLAIGGEDKATGDDFIGKLLADVKDSTQNITPLTTLVYQQLQDSADKSTSTMTMEKLETILGLSFEEIQGNMVTLANEGNTKAMQVALTLQKSAEALMPEDPLAFYAALAQKLKEADPIDPLSELILSLTPNDLKTEMLAFVEETMTTSLEDAYAMAEEAKDGALSRGLDFSSRMIAMQSGTESGSDHGTSSNEGIQTPVNPGEEMEIPVIPTNTTDDSNTSQPNNIPINPTKQEEPTSPGSPSIPSNPTNQSPSIPNPTGL